MTGTQFWTTACLLVLLDVSQQRPIWYILHDYVKVCWGQEYLQHHRKNMPRRCATMTSAAEHACVQHVHCTVCTPVPPSLSCYLPNAPLKAEWQTSHRTQADVCWCWKQVVSSVLQGDILWLMLLLCCCHCYCILCTHLEELNNVWVPKHAVIE